MTVWNATRPSLSARLVPSLCSSEFAHGVGDALAHRHDGGGVIGLQIREVLCVGLRDHQGVSAGDGADIEEGERRLVLVHTE